MLVIYCCLPLSEAHLLSLDKGLHDPDADEVELAHHKTVLCVTYLQSGNFDAARRYGEEAAAHCRAFGSIYGTNFIDFHLGSIAMARGDAQQAVQLYEKGRRKSRRHFSHDVGLRLIGDVLTAELDLERNAIFYVKRRLARVIDRLHDAEAWFEISAAAYGAASEGCLFERGLDETLGFLDQAQARAEHLRLAKLGPLLDDLKTTTARANDTLGQLDSTLIENRPDIRTSVTGLRDTVAKSTELLNGLNETLDQNSANIDALLDNIRMTTENLRTLTETLSRSPASLIRGIKVTDRKPGEIRK